MFNLLEKLRTKSRAQRTFIAFSISLLFTGVVFVVWFVAERKPESAEITKVIEENTPTNTVFKSMTDIWNGVVGTVKNAQETIKTIEFSSTVEYRSTTSTTSGTATTTP